MAPSAPDADLLQGTAGGFESACSAEDRARADAIHERLSRTDRPPEQYRGVIALSRTAIDLYGDLLEDIGERQEFDDA